MDYKLIGQRIRYERKKIKLTREKLAEIVDLSINYLGQIERGEKKFSVETIVKIADCLHINLDHLIKGTAACSDTNQQDELFDLLNKCSTKERLMIADIIKALLPHIKS